MSWVLDESDERLGRRLVLLALANYAHDDGTHAWPSIATLSRASRLSESQARRCLHQLEQAGAIVKTGTSRHGTGIYAVVMTPSQDDTPGKSATAPLANPPDPPRRMTPDPSLEQPPIGSSVQRAQPRAWKVDRVAVTDDEDALARDVLAGWNVHTRQRLASRDWLAKIVMRVREHPELTAVDHEAIIASTLNGNAWWSGPPTPSIIYGNGAQFERSMEQARQGNTSGARGALDVAHDEMQRIERQREEQS